MVEVAEGSPAAAPPWGTDPRERLELFARHGADCWCPSAAELGAALAAGRPAPDEDDDAASNRGMAAIG
jgi:hypothetical protein